MPNALIFGVTGQDGAYLARLLLEKGYTVTGTHQHERQPQIEGLQELGILEQVHLLPINYDDDTELTRLIEMAAPDEIYNLAAQSSVAESFKSPVETGLINGVFVARLLELLRQRAPQTRLLQASSSEMFGATKDVVLDEGTVIRPRNPYGTSKAYAHFMVGNYREAFGLHGSCGILFTHESPLRGPNFVSRKITLAAARIKLGLQDELVLGNTDVSRDWGFAGDYVEAMWRMLQQAQPDDYVVATGHLHALQDWVDLAFEIVGLESARYLRTDEQFRRPTDSVVVRANPAKAQSVLGWTAQMSFEELVKTMIEADLKRLAK